jgi:hypothetical protein
VKFIVVAMRLECRFPLILFYHANLVISRLQVQFREELRPS